MQQTMEPLKAQDFNIFYQERMADISDSEEE